jgi:hypothetical protein
MTSTRRPILLSLLLLCFGASPPASQQPAPEEPVPAARELPAIPIDDDARAEARWLYDTRCSFCHGPTGRGDGEGAGGLETRPRDFARSELLDRRGSGHLETIILRGGPSVGLSALMPPNPDLKAKPDVVAALRDIVRDLAQPHRGR